MSSARNRAGVSVEQVIQLPRLYSMSVPEEYLDEYRHMNVAYYIHAWRNGAQGMTKYLELGEDYAPGGTRGLWLLRQLLDYLAEVREGETIAIHGRIVRRTEKLMHNKYWMINETTQKIAATSEVLVANADLKSRRTADFDEAVSGRMDRHLHKMAKLGWDVPKAEGIHLR